MPSSVPWDFAETFRKQAERNHGQTLERLAERGGLAPEEMWAAANKHKVLNGAKFDEQAAIDWLNEQLARFQPEAPALSPEERAERAFTKADYEPDYVMRRPG